MRTGNTWIAASQTFLDLYTSGQVDERTKQIIDEYKQDAENVSREYNIVQNGGETYKLYSLTASGEQQIKQDIDYLNETWGNDVTVLGSWWFDTGIQGGMQPGENEGDLPTGTPFYPIPNNAWMFMPEEDGATSNDDLRDVNLMAGQAPRDFGQYV